MYPSKEEKVLIFLEHGKMHFKTDYEGQEGEKK